MGYNFLENESNSIFVCPSCHKKLNDYNEYLECEKCKKKYSITSGIVDFRNSDSYWCNVSREKINEVIRESRKSKNWFETAMKLIPEYVDHIAPYSRADAQFLWPIKSDSIVLDAGAMWGGLTIPLSQNSKFVYAVDQTLETLEFLNTRIEQSEIKNIKTVATPLSKLPFPDEYFDVIILNGVLEWVALEDSVVLEEHWTNKRNKILKHKINPKLMQIDVLLELNRILKKDGSLCLSIENAFGWPYLLGVWRDDHMNLLFTSFLPRFIANYISKKKLNCEYRTYTYSQYGLEKILEKAGFLKNKFYGAFEHYINPRYIIPFEEIKKNKDKVLPINHPKSNGFLNYLGKLFPSFLLKYISPSFIVVANKSKMADNSPKILKMLANKGIIKEELVDWQVIKTLVRTENWHTVNFIIYHKSNNQPKYFCKVARDNSQNQIIKDEIRNLKTAYNYFKNSILRDSIPKILFEGEENGISYYVTNYLKGEHLYFNTKISFSAKEIKKLDLAIKSCIDFLVNFQLITSQMNVNGKKYLLEKLNYYESRKESVKNQNTELFLRMIWSIREKINQIPEFELLIPSSHGDFDFDNIIFDKSFVKITDFEHFEEMGFPFLDIAHLIFNPLIMAYERSGKQEKFQEFLLRNKVDGLVFEWMKEYITKMRVPEDLINYIFQFVALEHLFKEYPKYRNPSTLPFGSNTLINDILFIK